MSNESQTVQFTPIRPLKEFIEGNEWAKPNLKQWSILQKQIVSNLIYFQSNYGIVLAVFILLSMFFRPISTIFSVFIMALLLVAFVFSTREKTILTIHVFDRPVAVILLLFIASCILVTMYGSIFVHLFAVGIPLTLIMVHAAARKQSVQNKAANSAESLSWKTSPMGFLLTWLGTRSHAALVEKSN